MDFVDIEGFVVLGRLRKFLVVVVVFIMRDWISLVYIISWNWMFVVCVVD